MKAIALSIATFASIPSANAPAWTLALEPTVQWQPMDFEELDEPMPELDESLLADIPLHRIEYEIAVERCDLSLVGGLAPEEWSRELWLGAPLGVPVWNWHIDKVGRWVDYDQIPRRPGRPEEYIAYRYPVDAPIVSGYDLDKPNAEQRRGKMNAVGHGGLDLVAPFGTTIEMIRLDHQIGDAEVVYVGWLFGNTVVTRHTVREGGADLDYVLLFGHLYRSAPDVRRGAHLPEGAVVGFVGNSDSPNLVHLHLEARRMRDDVDVWGVPLYELRDKSIVTDPRNVLPLRAPPLRDTSCALRPSQRARTYWLGSDMGLSLE